MLKPKHKRCKPKVQIDFYLNEAQKNKNVKNKTKLQNKIKPQINIGYIESNGSYLFLCPFGLWGPN